MIGDKESLSAAGRSGRAPRSDEDVVAGVVRLVRAVGKRAAENDPDSGVWLRMLQEELADAFGRAVAAWRRSGFSDADIGRELGVSKQAVQQRWPRGGDA